MNKMRIFSALVILLCGTQAFADQYRPSKEALWVMSDTHLVLHEHDTSQQHTELRIIERETGKETYRGDSTTFTRLVTVEDGKYFAGLSHLALQSRDYGYNFALFTPEGEMLSRAYISTVTGYCGRVRQSVNMYVYWFRDPLEISLVIENDSPIAVKVGQRCTIPMGDHRETPESYQAKVQECRENDCYRRRQRTTAGQCKPDEPLIYE